MSDFQHEAGRFAAFIDRADREEMEAVQGDLLRIALERPDPAGRAQAMDSLQAALSDRIRPDAMSPLQQAFYVAVLSMIERTKEAVAKAPARAE
ncbi:protein of unknown function [Methylorubrum extorquens]|uniref:Uncharacterized protein n=1 Tax=Methylorubrum extorquens TaxID=408 RepID=A0A2N9AIP8_METEX|nr:hypothetical protein [Methylorubrum zatmanii]ARO53618.1 hypothetical protein B2G69_05285 [Methylorubrum zatmanii]KQP99646.1 hypothetical protein ASF59_09530 [Methylobacterium sp. Leaf121]SOR27235.1 protein of unknown function [Methylorubrum extorquens]